MAFADTVIIKDFARPRKDALVAILIVIAMSVSTEPKYLCAWSVE